MIVYYLRKISKSHNYGREDIAYTFSDSFERLKAEDIVSMSSSPLYLGSPNRTKISGSHLIGIYYVPGHFVVRAKMDVACNKKRNE